MEVFYISIKQSLYRKIFYLLWHYDGLVKMFQMLASERRKERLSQQTASAETCE